LEGFHPKGQEERIPG